MMTADKTPEISVIMSVYNSERFLKESVDSILNQTFRNFEFIITDDCSTDGTLGMLEDYTSEDSRIVLIRNERNKGLTKNLNSMINIAKGKYIARLDADDISLPERLEKQYRFMEKNTSVGVLGTDGSIFGDKRKTIVIDRPSTHEEIRVAFAFENLLIHSSAFIRRSVLEEKNIRYDENFKIIQDYELWTRLSSETEFRILNEKLVNYRVSETNISSITEKQENYREEILKKIYLNYFEVHKFSVANNQLDTHVTMLHRKKLDNINTPDEIHEWLLYLMKQNEITRSFDNKYFNYMISKHWYKTCTRSTSLGLSVMFRYFRSELSKNYSPGFIVLMRFVLKCIVRY